MTKEQERAANFLWENPHKKCVQLIAGAGSGKTTTLIEAIKAYVHNQSNAENVCFITFTKKAAHEMKERLSKQNISAGFIGTIHSFAYQLIRKDGKEKLNIIQDSNEIYKKLVEEKFQELKYIPMEFLFHRGQTQNERVRELKNNYEKYKEEKNLYDFDDLITKSIRLLHDKSIENPYPVVLVDEFQDTSPLQVEFIRALEPKKLFVVGDDWQSIYKFRGADVSVNINFAKTFKGSTRMFLTRNFRSQKRIVKLGNQAIKLSKEYIRKKLVAHKKRESRPTCLIFYKKSNESDSHQRILKKMLLWNSKNCPLSEATILVRTNREQAILEKIIPTGFDVMTLHSSKGLEFENVIIWGIQKKNIPHEWGDLDEEVRLLYVGITRAKSRLQFVAIEEENHHSSFLPFLNSKCRVAYI